MVLRMLRRPTMRDNRGPGDDETLAAQDLLGRGAMRSCRNIAIVLTAIGASCSSPASPTATVTTTLQSIRYVRTRVASLSGQFVDLEYAIPIPGDTQGRSRMSAVRLRSVDDVTFVYDVPTVFQVPINTECTFYVDDPAVSQFYVARDIFVNDTRIRVETAGNVEAGRFKVTPRGVVY